MARLEIQSPLWRFFASVRLLIGLLLFFILICAVGAIVPQNLQPEEIITRYGPVKAVWLQRLHFTDIFHSWYLAFLLIGLSVNVIACTTRRMMMKAMHGIRLVGYLILHLGLIILFAGGTISSLSEQKGFLQIWEGKNSNQFWSWANRAWRPLPFTVALNQFTVERYPEYEAPTVLASIPEQSYAQEFPADLKQTFQVGGAGYQVTPLRYLPDFALDFKTGQAFARSEAPNNPALLVEIRGEKGIERRWLLANYPQLQMAKDSRLQLLYRWQPLKVKQFVSQVKILEPGPVALKEVKQATIAVNRPLRYRGWRIYQTSFDPQEQRWSGFQISNDPGEKIVYAGFLLLAAGTIIMLGLGPLLNPNGVKNG